MATNNDFSVMPPQTELLDMNTDSFPFSVISSGKTFALKNSFEMIKSAGTHLLIYTISGQGHIAYGGREICLDRNEAVLIDCSRPFEYSPSVEVKQDKQWVFCWLYFSSPYNKTYHDLLYSNTSGKASTRSEADMMMQFVQIFESLKKPSIKNACIQSDALSRILTALITDMDLLAADTANDQEYLKRIPGVIHIIERDYWQRMTVDDLANAVGLSKYYFTRVFKKYTGIPPYQFIINQRINQAKKLLEDTELSMHEISVMTGFYDKANFCKKFKMHVGLAPLDYRKSLSPKNTKR